MTNSKCKFITEPTTGERYTVISEFPVAEYRCGLKAGDQVRLKKPFAVKASTDRATGEVHPRGEIWTVLRGSDIDGDMWLRQADGSQTFWEDDREAVDEWFELITESKKRSPRSVQKELLTSTPYVLRIEMADAYNKREEIYHRKGKLDKAVADCSEAIEINPKYSTAYVNRGSAYSSKGQYTEAIADFNMAIRMNPSDAVVYNERAI
jgi:tetratricopeptide (TPR) repeat protein